MGDIDLFEDIFDLPEDAAPMNEALQEWAATHREEVEAAKKDASARPVRGPCSMCQAAAIMRCLRCGRPVCTRHHHVMVGICVRCTDEIAAEEAESGSGAEADPYADERPPPRPELDLDWIE